MGNSSQGDNESEFEDAHKYFAQGLKVITEENECHTCVFCKTYTVNEIKLGPLYYQDGVVTHYFCMVISALFIL